MPQPAQHVAMKKLHHKSDWSTPHRDAMVQETMLQPSME